jgi:hypothetical protein
VIVVGYKKKIEEVEVHERKRDITDDPEVLKNLFLRMIGRSLMDCTGKTLALSSSVRTANYIGRLANVSLRFLRSEWGQDICEFVNLDRDTLLRTAKLYIKQSKEGTYKKVGRGL